MPKKESASQRTPDKSSSRNSATKSDKKTRDSDKESNVKKKPHSEGGGIPAFPRYSLTIDGIPLIPRG